MDENQLYYKIVDYVRNTFGGTYVPPGEKSSIRLYRDDDRLVHQTCIGLYSQIKPRSKAYIIQHLLVLPNDEYVMPEDPKKCVCVTITSGGICRYKIHKIGGCPHCVYTLKGSLNCW